MLGPAMFIGVGGSGGNTVRAIREILWNRLQGIGWDKDFPSCWQTLWIDTMTEQSKNNFMAPTLPSKNYHGIVPKGGKYLELRQRIERSLNDDVRNRTLAGWLPETTTVPIEKGAGQFRALGRAVGVSGLSQTKKFLEDSYADMTRGESSNDLQRINELLGLQAQGKPNTNVYIISSMAGGSGSGLFQDVAEILKSINSSLDNFMHVMLYGSDIFLLNIAKSDLKRIHGNTLGALAEVLNGVWSQEKSDATRELYEAVGMSIEDERYGGKYHWLIGSKNNQRSLGNSASDIFYAVASSVATLAMSDETRSNFDDFANTNVFPGTYLNLDETGLKTEQNRSHFQPVAAMGFGRITLGMDRFTQYSTEAITREIIDQRLLWPTNSLSNDGTDENQQARISDRADSMWPTFLTNTGLRERGDKDNQVLDALKGNEKALSDFIVECEQTATGQGKNPAYSPEEWHKRIGSFFKNNKQETLNLEKISMYKSAQVWAIEIQNKILSAVADAMINGGLKVTVKLLERVIEEMHFLVNEELPAERKEKIRLSDELSGLVHKALNLLKKQKIEPRDKEVKQSMDEVRNSLDHLADSERIGIAIELLTDLNKNFLHPLKNAVISRIEDLESDILKKEHKFKEFVEFPDSDKTAVPEKFKPVSTEESLIDMSEFPTLLREWTQASIDPQVKDNWKARVIERAFLGKKLDFLGDDEVQSAVVIKSAWIPEGVNYKIEGYPQAASFSLNILVSDIYPRVKDMIQNRAGFLTEKVRMGIRPFLTKNSPSVNDVRQSAFFAKLSTALDSARPMMEENASVLNLLHGDDKPGVSALFSTVPLAGLPTLKSKFQEIVKKWDSEVKNIDDDKIYSASDSEREITIFCTSKGAVNPAVFDTLMGPIYADWMTKRRSHQGRIEFWTDRRTKPLLESIPAAKSVIRSMIKGWITLTFTDLRRNPDSDKARGPKVSVYNVESEKWQDFPHPLLNTIEKPDTYDYLPAVLLSISIALMEVNNSSSISPLQPYHALLLAGGDETENILRKYIFGEQIASDVPVDSETPEARKEILVKALGEEIDIISAMVEEEEAIDVPYSKPQSYELSPLWLSALKEIQDLTERISTDLKAKKGRG